jgi:hypothetical protein
MKILQFQKDSDEWLEARNTVISGTKVKEVKPPTRKVKTGLQTIGFWGLIAEYLSYGVEEESPMVRGTHLEDENAQLAIEKLHLENGKYNVGALWQTDDGLLGYSPDAFEDTEKPKWAIECKSLKTAEHIYLIARDMAAKGKLPSAAASQFSIEKEYRGIDYVAEEHQLQIKQAFVVNPELETVYYSLYDPRVFVEGLRHYIITVRRSEMKEDIAEQKEMVERQAKLARTIAKCLVNLKGE